LKYGRDIRSFHQYIAIHINDTHPALAVPELMRILMDECGLGWDEAWNITVNTISYTNHTILPEALERWSRDIFSSLLPRIYMITHEIDERFRAALRERYPGQWDRIESMAIESGGEIRMAYLAVVGSHMVNGVSQVHSDILVRELFSNFNDMFPERFMNITNGVTHRRWLIQSNPSLAELITDAIGPSWKSEPKKLALLDTQGYTENSVFLERLRRIKHENRKKLAAFVQNSKNITLNPHSIYDVQVKRIHAYKRQLLLAFYILDLYYRIIDGRLDGFVPHTFIIGGKAAPSYYLAKEIIKFISTVADIVNNDSRVGDLLKVVFLENYRVSLAEIIFPASDVSEQISTASKEASGTGNMKFMMNGAITLGTWDGANIEIFNAVGEGNFFSFGLSVSEVLSYYRSGSYRSREYYESDERIKRIIDNHINTRPGLVGRAEFPNIYDSIMTYNDEFFVLRDFDAYLGAHDSVSASYSDRMHWQIMSAKNIAYAGIFSSDEAVKKYAKDIWHA